MLSFYASILFIVCLAHAHSWVERIYVVRDGKMIGAPGYPRGNGKNSNSALRMDTYQTVWRTPTFKDQDMVYLLPPTGRANNQVLLSDLACKETQRTRNYTNASPMLIAKPSDHIRLLYQENGHVTRISEDPGHNGTSGIITVVGSRSTTGADTIQDLLETITNEVAHISSFDDGNCYQANGTPEAIRRQRLIGRQRLDIEGPDHWCGQDFVLPSSLEHGDIYTLFWIWNFDGIGFRQIYTTCMDVHIFVY